MRRLGSTSSSPACSRRRPRRGPNRPPRWRGSYAKFSKSSAIARASASRAPVPSTRRRRASRPPPPAAAAAGWSRRSSPRAFRRGRRALVCSRTCARAARTRRSSAAMPSSPISACARLSATRPCARSILGLRVAKLNASVGVATGRTRIDRTRPTGEVVDRAAALARDAQRGQVLADTTTSELTRGRFELQLRGDGSAVVGTALRGQARDRRRRSVRRTRGRARADRLGLRAVRRRSDAYRRHGHRDARHRQDPDAARSALANREPRERAAHRPRAQRVVRQEPRAGRGGRHRARPDRRGQGSAAPRGARRDRCAHRRQRGHVLGYLARAARAPRGQRGPPRARRHARRARRALARPHRHDRRHGTPEPARDRARGRPVGRRREPRVGRPPPGARRGAALYASWPRHGRPSGATIRRASKVATTCASSCGRCRASKRAPSQPPSSASVRTASRARPSPIPSRSSPPDCRCSPRSSRASPRPGRDASDAPTIESAMQVHIDALDDFGREAAAKLAVFGLVGWDVGLEALGVPNAGEVLRELAAAGDPRRAGARPVRRDARVWLQACAHARGGLRVSRRGVAEGVSRAGRSLARKRRGGRRGRRTPPRSRRGGGRRGGLPGEGGATLARGARARRGGIARGEGARVRGGQADAVCPGADPRRGLGPSRCTGGRARNGGPGDAGGRSRQGERGARAGCPAAVRGRERRRRRDERATRRGTARGPGGRLGRRGGALRRGARRPIRLRRRARESSGGRRRAADAFSAAQHRRRGGRTPGRRSRSCGRLAARWAPRSKRVAARRARRAQRGSRHARRCSPSTSALR